MEQHQIIYVQFYNAIDYDYYIILLFDIPEHEKATDL